MNKIHKIRTTLIFLFFCCLYFTIIVNLYLIQIKQNRFFTHLGEKQYYVTIKTTPPRAPIIDRNGQALAINKDSVAAFILPNKLSTPQTVATFLQHHFPDALNRLERYKNNHFMFIKRRLTQEEIALIEHNKIDDIKLLKEPSRFYPVPSAGPITGITNVDNEGLFGIELQYNKQLAGKPKTFTLEKDARSSRFYFKKETKIEGTDSKPIQLTIDNDLQFLAHEELKKIVESSNAKEGCIIVMNPDNGEIIVMANAPTFDPNNTHTLQIEHTKNKIITESYELGSVMKTFAALAAFEEGVVTCDELIDCENKETTYVNKRRINTPVAAGVMPFWEIIARSNNIGIAKVVLRLGDLLYDHYIRTGFGKKTGINFPGEQSGFVNPPYNWSKQSIFSLSYGYEITGTLLQLARAFSIIANGGHDIQPTLLAQQNNMIGKQLYSQDSIDHIKKILTATVQEGTAHRAKIKGYDVMCKTGTAILLENGKYKPNKHIYTCAGIIEKDNYRRVIVAFIKEANRKNAFAATIAVPLFKRIAQKTIIHDKIVA